MSALAARSKVAGSFASMVASDSEPDFDDFGVASHDAARDIAKRVTGSKSSRIRHSSHADRVVKRPTGGRHNGDAQQYVLPAPSVRRALRDKSNTNFNSLGQVRQAKLGAQGHHKPPRKMAVLQTEVEMHNPSGEYNEHVAKYSNQPPSTYESTQEQFDAEAVHVESEGHFEMTDRSLSRAYLDQGQESTRQTAGQDIIGDKSARRRLGDMMKKYEGLESRHMELRDIGVKAAERNFEKLKNQMEENTAASNKLIQQLKDELTSQSAQVRDGQRIRQQLQASEDSVAKMEDRIVELTASLSQANAEIKSLSAKLAASRAAETSSKAPGSTTKFRTGGCRAPLTTSDQTLAAQTKEDLYGDLTGLIIRGMARSEDETIYDCIQTGRNGTLHFRLGLGGGDGPHSYDHAQFIYRPQLDEERDGELMEILPDYLVEEISFPRTQAAKFYSRVNRSLMER